jgi:hypothetical protein
MTLRHDSETGLRMRTMRTMNRAAPAATAVLAFVGLGLWSPPQAMAQNAGVEEKAPPAPPVRPHPPVRIRVHPLTQTLGPDAVRQCQSWLAPEYRPSGTVIVPKMRCWWERG